MPNFFAELEKTAQRYPGSPAFASSGGIIDYEGIACAVKNVADNAAVNGLAAGDLVHIKSTNPGARLLLLLGLMRAGLTVAVTQRSSTYVENGVTLDVVLSDRTAKRYPAVAKRGLDISPSWFQPVKERSKLREDNKDYALMVTSSGSTGTPKLIRASRSAVERQIAARFDDPYFGGDLRYLGAAGNTVLVPTLVDYMITLMRGGLAVQMDRNTAQTVLDASTLYLPSYVAMTPALLVDVLSTLGSSPRKSTKVRYLRVAGAYCTVATRQKALAGYADNVLIAYGTTETGTVAWGELPDVSGTEGCVGRIMNDFTVETVDESGCPLPAGAEGELRIRPPSSTATYLSTEGEIDVLRDGWFYPRDIGRVDPSGRLIYKGRKSTVINAGGRKISPEVIEAALADMPGVRDVAVAPSPTPFGYQGICVLIVESSPISIPEVKSFLARRKKSFAITTLRHVSAIPRTERGKIDRQAVIELAEQLSRHVGHLESGNSCFQADGGEAIIDRLFGS